FIFYPISGDQIFMVTGVGRVVFSVLSVIIVYGFYKMPFEFNNVLGKALSHLGTITYGVYLLHPLVYGVLLVISKRFRVILHPAVMVFAVLALTIILALIVYHLYELKFIQIGKRLTQRTPQFENR
ncbi:acyltransferase, partial [Myxococcota bacterium]|nr:acyltransferase [Myxococcota bacterium]